MNSHDQTNRSDSAFWVRVMCSLGRHRPKNRQARWDGQTFVSRCEACGEPIRRIGKHKWRRDQERMGD